MNKTFGTNGDGNLYINPSSGEDQMFTIAIDNDYIYVGGDDSINGTSNTQWRLEKRKKSDGSLVTTFNGDGIYQNNPSSGNETIYTMATDNDYIYTAGCSRATDGSSQWRIEKINKTTGLLESSFGTNGVVIENYGNNEDRIYGITLDNNYIYLAGEIGWNNWTALAWRIEKRTITTGALASTFGINGIIDEYTSAYLDSPNYMIQSNSYLYIVGYDSITAGDRQWRIEKRNISNGMFDSGFGVNGIIQENFSTDQDCCEKICVDNDFIYSGGWERSKGGGNEQWRIEKRHIINGGL